MGGRPTLPLWSAVGGAVATPGTPPRTADHSVTCAHAPSHALVPFRGEGARRGRETNAGPNLNSTTTAKRKNQCGVIPRLHIPGAIPGGYLEYPDPLRGSVLNRGYDLPQPGVRPRTRRARAGAGCSARSTPLASALAPAARQPPPHGAPRPRSVMHTASRTVNLGGMVRTRPRLEVRARSYCVCAQYKPRGSRHTAVLPGAQALLAQLAQGMCA